MTKSTGIILVIVASVALFSTVIIVFSLVDEYLTRQAKTDVTTTTSKCSKLGSTHTVSITDDQITPINTNAKLCDLLRITSYDNKVREIGFGPHEKHAAYNGISEQILDTQQSFTVTLNSKGSYSFHDHFQEEVIGYFEVK